MKYRKIALALGALGATATLAACGNSEMSAKPDSKSAEDQVRAATKGFMDSVESNDGECLKYVAKDAQGLMVAFAGGCDGLHDLWKSSDDSGYDVDKAKVVVKGKTATITEPGDGEVSNLVLEGGDWKYTLDEDETAEASTDEATDELASDEVEEEPAEPQTETASVGDSITLDAGSLELEATVVSATDTITPVLDEYGFGDEPGRGMRFAGVTLTVKNVGTEPWDPSMADHILVMRDDSEAEDAYMSDTPPWDSMPEARLRPGKTLKLNLPYEVPKSGKLGRFQITVMNDKSFDEFTGEWDL